MGDLCQIYSLNFTNKTIFLAIFGIDFWLIFFSNIHGWAGFVEIPFFSIRILNRNRSLLHHIDEVNDYSCRIMSSICWSNKANFQKKNYPVQCFINCCYGRATMNSCLLFISVNQNGCLFNAKSSLIPSLITVLSTPLMKLWLSLRSHPND